MAYLVTGQELRTVRTVTARIWGGSLRANLEQLHGASRQPGQPSNNKGPLPEACSARGRA